MSEWTSNSRSGEKTSKWDFECRRAAEDSAVIYHEAGDDMIAVKPNSGSGILGWDAEKQLVVKLEIDADGLKSHSTTMNKFSGDAYTRNLTIVDGEKDK